MDKSLNKPKHRKAIDLSKKGENMDIKLLKKGIKINGEYFACHYSSAKNNRNGNATIYIKSYEPLPKEAYSVLQVENNSDIMTDYFEKDRIRISPISPYFKQVEALATY